MPTPEPRIAVSCSSNGLYAAMYEGAPMPAEVNAVIAILDAIVVSGSIVIA